MVCEECGGEGFIIVDEVRQVTYEYDIVGVYYDCPNPNCDAKHDRYVITQ